MRLGRQIWDLQMHMLHKASPIESCISKLNKTII